MAFNLTKPILGLICLHDVTQESVAALTDHFTNVFVRKNVARVYDDRKFEADAILFREIQCKKWDILMFRPRFQYSLG